MPLRFELAEPQNALEHTEFHNRAYGTKRDPKFWLWEYFGQVSVSGVVARVLDGNQLVGTQGMIPIVMNIGGTPTLTAKSEGTLLSPEYRGLGVLADLYDFAIDECARRGVQLIWGFTPADKALRQSGFETFRVGQYLSSDRANRIPAMRSLPSEYRPGKPMIRRLGSEVKGLGFALRARLSRAPQRHNHLTRESTLREISFSDFVGLSLLDTSMRANDVEIQRSPEYLRWRWLDNPTGATKFVALYGADDAVAWAVLRTSMGRLTIADYAATIDEAQHMLIYSIRDRYSRNHASIQAFANGDYARSHSSSWTMQNDFARTNTTNFVLRQVNSTNKALPDVARWRFTSAWTEGYGA